MSTNIIQKIIDDAVDYAVGIANDNTHGYSQATRSLYNITNPKSFDCSSLVLTAYYYAFMKNGLTKQAEYLKANCSYTGNMMKMLNCGFEVVATNQTAHSQMQKGDIELNIIYHTAMAVDNNRIVHARSSEGTSDIKDNSGNEIRVQPWYLYSKKWDKRLRFTGKGIDFSSATSNNTSSFSAPSSSSNKELIKQAQRELNSFVGDNLAVDGIAGQATKTAYRKGMQRALNKDYNCGLVEDGVIGDKTNAVLKKVSVKKGNKGYMVSAVEIGMLLNGYDPKGVEYPGVYGDGLFASICRYQLSKGLDGKGIVAKRTFAKLVE